MRSRRLERARGACLVAALILSGAACTSSSTTTSPTTISPSQSTTTVPVGLSVTSFDSSYSEMTRLTGLTGLNKRLVGVILSGEAGGLDVPNLARAFQTAGYTGYEYRIDYAQGSGGVELSLAEADISRGAAVLAFDPVDTAVGNQIADLASKHDVKLISVDRPTFAGTNTYYVSFNDVTVGRLIGTGFESCVSSWGLARPQVFELDGDEVTDPTAIWSADGYNSVIWGKDSTPLRVGLTNSLGYMLLGEQTTPRASDASVAGIFQKELAAHPNVNATVEATDGLANAVIGDLKRRGVGPKKVPTTGEGATLRGMEWVLDGYQCGSVYEPGYMEAQDVVALATLLRAGQTPPSTLVNSVAVAPTNAGGNIQPASLLTPEWVTGSNMASTVIKDRFIEPAALCQVVGATLCLSAGVTP